MGRHDDSPEGRADDHTGCSGENRQDPDSWADPDIRDAWQAPLVVEPAQLDENGQVPLCS